MSLRLCVILGQARPPGPGERRFLAALAGDSRFDLAALCEAPLPAPTLPGAWRGALGIEARIFPIPDQAPPMERAPVPLDAIRDQTFDVVIDFSMGEAALGLAGAARFGLWRLSSFDETAGLTDARLRSPSGLVALIQHRPGTRQVLATARYDTKFLASWNRAYLREKSVQLAQRELARLAEAGHLPAPAEAPAMPAAPRLRELPDYLAARTREITMRTVRWAETRLGRRPGMFFLRLARGALPEVRLDEGVDLVAPPGRFWADPFLIEEAGVTYLFYEEFDYATGLGHLSVGRLDGMEMQPLGPVMQRPFHLSFPFVFRWKDEILMIPETHQAKRIEVWRAVAFPLKWELAATGFEGIEAADTVVFERDGQWWLMTNQCADSFGDFVTELHLYRIDDPMLGGAVAHPLNPVVIDAETARGGGRVFARDGRLYRASQDNSHGIYGYGLNLMEITTLSDSAYAERRVRHLTTDALPGLMGAHHMDAAGGYTVVDLRRQHTGLHRSGRG